MVASINVHSSNYVDRFLDATSCHYFRLTFVNQKVANFKMTFDVRLQCNFNCLVSGHSGSGKTTLVKNLLRLRNQIFSVNPEKIYLFYNNDQPIYNEMIRERLVDEKFDVKVNFPSLEYLTTLVAPYKKGSGCLIIFDDIIADLNEEFTKIICNFSHHESTSIILMTQNLFYQHKVFRTISLNMHYMFLMTNERDKQQIMTLGRQVCPNNPNFLVNVYSAAASKAYEYLLLDFRVDQNRKVRIRSHIFPHQFPMKVYNEV